MATVRVPIEAPTLKRLGLKLHPKRSVLIRGRHGIGKSEIVHQIALGLELPVIDRRLSQMGEGDMIGLPDRLDGATTFLPPDWFLAACRQPHVLFLDEINRATPEVQQAAFQIVLSHELNGHKLHAETRVYAAVNDTAEYQINEMDPALLDRFSVYDFKPTVDNWLDWASDRSQGNIDPLIVEFINKNREFLEVPEGQVVTPGAVTPSRRSWAWTDACLKSANLVPSEIAGESSDPLFYNIVAGIVGVEAAASLTQFVEKYSMIVSAENIMDEWPKYKRRVEKMTNDQWVALVDKTGKAIKDMKIADFPDSRRDNLVAFWKSLPDELVFKAWGELTNCQDLEVVKACHRKFAMKVVNAAQAMMAKEKEENEAKAKAAQAGR